MSGLGWFNAPLELGSDTSKIEDIYNALRSAVGIGGPGPKDGLEDLWRQCKASVIASGVTSVERAALQAFPNIATDHVPVYERNLLLTPAVGASDEDRRQAAAQAWTLNILSQMPSIKASLEAIDPAFDLDELDYQYTTLVKFGKVMPPRGFEASYGYARWPNYSDDFLLLVTYTLTGGATTPPVASLAAAKRLLNKVLPANVDWQIYTSVGFFLDGGADGSSLLDQTAFD